VPNGPEDLRPSGFSFPIEVRPNGLRRFASRTDRKEARHRREVADIAIDDAEQRSDGRLVRRDAVEITHELRRYC
jgi:hypothetical protein